MTRGTGRQPAAERHRALLGAHREWIAAYAEEPSVRELSKAVDLSPSMVSHYLTQMRAQGSDVPTRGWRSRRRPHCGR